MFTLNDDQLQDAIDGLSLYLVSVLNEGRRDEIPYLFDSMSKTLRELQEMKKAVNMTRGMN